jgi:hypothetical protein
MADRHGLIVDYGGVLTSDPFASFEAFCAAERLAPDTVRDRLRNDPAARDLLVRLETGALTAPEFELAFGALLGVSHPQLLQRMFGGLEPDTAMIDGVRALRRPGRHRPALELDRRRLRPRAARRAVRRLRDLERGRPAQAGPGDL